MRYFTYTLLATVRFMNETQKLHICEAFDKASTEDEAMLTYKKILDELKKNC